MPKGVYERKSEEQRFWEKVVVGEEQNCWLWTASVDPDGYGWFSQNSKTVLAHRYSAQLKYGDISGLLVRHTCDNRSCVNPAHLLLGTPADNSADMKERNRQAWGDKAYNSTLTNDQAFSILKRYEQEKAAGKLYGVLERIAQEFGVSKQNVYRITARKTYKHLVVE